MAHQALPEIYSAADALILASSREGWANVLLEAMACGTPVVASDVWGTKEAIGAPEAGILMGDRSADGIAEGVRRLFAALPESRQHAPLCRTLQLECDDTGSTGSLHRDHRRPASPASDPANGMMRPPRTLLHVFPTFAVGGAQMRFVQLANYFGRSYRHLIVSMNGKVDAFGLLSDDLDVRLLDIPVEHGKTGANLKAFRRVLKDLRPDLLVTSNWGSIEWALANWGGLSPHLHMEDGFGSDEVARQLPAPGMDAPPGLTPLDRQCCRP